MKIFLILLSLSIFLLQGSTVAATAQSITYTGYLVDIYCWNLPQHVGLDGTNLELRPEEHLLHCIADEAPCRSGLLLLEKYNDGGDEKFRDKYYLDARGNQLGYQYYDREFTNGDRKISELATVTGNVTGATGVIVVESITFSDPNDDTLVYIILGGIAGGVLVLSSVFYVAVQLGWIPKREVDDGKVTP